MDLSIIIVSWNIKNKLRENLKSIYNNTQNIDFEVFVVDNNSKDNTVEMVKKEFPQIKLITNIENLGFAKANNQAIKITNGKYILLLNPDMQVLGGSLENMVNWMDQNSKASIAGCKLINEKNEIIPHVRAFPTIWDQLAIVLKLPHIFPRILDKYLMRDFDYSRAREVDSIRGSFFMIRRNIIDKIGLLDERYFIWFEEVDYCRQAKKADLKIMYTPAAKCIDHVGQSFKQVNRCKTQIYFRDSMLKYFRKWQPIWQYWILKLAWPIGISIAILGEKLNFKSVQKRHSTSHILD